MANFYEAHFPVPFHVLGLPLKPFSLGHHILLCRADSACVRPGERISFDDFIFAVLICSRTYEESVAFFLSDWTVELKRWAKRLRKIDLAQAQFVFSSYLIQGHTRPNFRFLVESEDFVFGSPWEQRIKIVLMENMGFTESQLLNRHLPLCWWDLLTHDELKGSIQITEGETAQFEDEMFKQADEFAKTLKR